MTYTQRDPARIDRMVESLREAWHLVPDWQLGQLIVNTADVTDHTCTIFGMGDETIEKQLSSLIVWLESRNQPKAPDDGLEK